MLAPIHRQLQELGSALPSSLSEHFGPTVEGLGAVIKMIELISELDNTLISRRSEHFDEDDFDPIIKISKRSCIIAPLTRNNSGTF